MEISIFERKHLDAILQTCSVMLSSATWSITTTYSVPMTMCHGCEVSSFKTLASITVAQDGPLGSVLSSITENSSTAGALVFSWAMSQNIIPITTTSKEGRMEEYLSAVDLALDSDELEEITQVGLNYHFRWWDKRYLDPEDRS